VQIASPNCAMARKSGENQGMAAPIELDAIDRRTLRALQRNGRLTFDELAGEVGLSGSAALRRVRRLEHGGVISGYRAQVNAESVGLGLAAYITVRLAKQNESRQRSPMESFRAAVQVWPEVVECAALSGEMDLLLQVLVQDMAHYSRFIMDTLLAHPSVQDCKTSFVLQRLKTDAAVPV
jgi:Lrp/AsnC family transcriptional regulator, leucine-responsive regulatory protein